MLLQAQCGAAVTTTSTTTTTTTTTAAQYYGSLVDTLLALPNTFSSFQAMLMGSPGLMNTLAGPGPLTLFAPSNDAFAFLDPDYYAALQVCVGLYMRVFVIRFSTNANLERPDRPGQRGQLPFVHWRTVHA
jgi:hypothetical protein